LLEPYTRSEMNIYIMYKKQNNFEPHADTLQHANAKNRRIIESKDARLLRLSLFTTLSLCLSCVRRTFTTSHPCHSIRHDGFKPVGWKEYMQFPITAGPHNTATMVRTSSYVHEFCYLLLERKGVALESDWVCSCILTPDACFYLRLPVLVPKPLAYLRCMHV